MKFRLHHIPQIFADAVLIAVSLFVSFLIRFEFALPNHWPKDDLHVFVNTLGVFIVVKLLVFFLNGLYDRMWRYVSIRELMVLLRATLISAVTLVFLIFFIMTPNLRTGFSRSVIVIDTLLTFLLVGGARFGVRFLYETRRHRSVLDNSKPVLVFGAGDAGEIMVREMLKHPDMEYDPVGFIDDDATKRGRRIHGVEVLGDRDDIPHLVDKYDVEEVIVAIPSAPGRVIREVAAICDEVDVKVKTLPGVFELIDGRVGLSEIRDVRVEDLLGRDPVKIDLTEAKKYLDDKVVLVTGAAGSIGSELCRQIARFRPRRLLLLDHNENDLYYLALELKKKIPDLPFDLVVGDIKDKVWLEHVFDKFKPYVVFHAAAHKHVPLMQENISSAVLNNVTGSKNLIEVAKKHKAGRFVLISTDKAVDPTTIMGTTKRIAEMVLQSYADGGETKLMAVRFGNVMGSNASVASIFKKQIEEGGPVTVTHPDATRYFMSVSEATQLVLQAGAIGAGGEIFLLDMGEPVKIIDLARNLIRLSGYEPGTDIPIEITGMRPGDEITEDLVGKNEKVTKTIQNKIMVVSNGKFDRAKFLEELAELEHLVKTHDPGKINVQMKLMVPTYKAELPSA